MIKKSATIPLQYDTAFSPFSKEEFDSALEWLQKSGFEGAEIVISEPLKVNIDVLNKNLQKNHLEVSTIATGQAVSMEGISLTDNSPDIRERAVNRIREHIDLSVEIGHPNVTIGLIRGIGDPKLKNLHLNVLKEELKKCIAYAQKRNVLLNLEPINRYETTLLNSCEETLDFLKELGNPDKVGILYDTFHSNIEDRDMISAIVKLGAKISHIHFADSNRWLPGEGHTDFKSIIEKLTEIDYKGYISIETLNLPDKEMIKKNAEASIKKIFGW